MNIFRVRYRILWTLIFFMLFSCAGSTELKYWRNGAYEGGIVKSIMIVGISKDAEIRKYFEEVFSKRFSRAGIKAVASNKVIPSGQAPDKDAVKTAAEKQGMQAILVTHLSQEGEKDFYQPPATGGANGLSYYYSRVYNSVYVTGYYKKEKFVKLVSNLYDTASEEVIWTGVSQHIEPKSAKDIIGALAPKVIKGMRSDKVIR